LGKNASLRRFRIVATAGGKRRPLANRCAPSEQLAVAEFLDKHRQRGSDVRVDAVDEVRGGLC